MIKKIFTIIAMLFFAKLSFSQLMWVEQNSGTTQTLTSIDCVSQFPWACGYGGTVLKGNILGGSWTNVSGNGIPTNAQLINVAAIDNNRALVAGYIGSSTFVYRTDNSGANWYQVFSQVNGFINAISLKVTTDNMGFMMGDPVGGRWSLWKTTNAGFNWDSSGLYLQQIGSEAGWNNSMFSYENNIWFGTNNSKIYYSSNFGTTWTSQSTAGEINSYAVWFCGIQDIAGYTGFVGGSSLFKTTNSGMNWISQSSTGSGNFGGITGGPNFLIDNIAGYLHRCYVRGDNKIYCSTNNGTNWTVEHTATSGTYRYIASDYNGTHFWGVRNNGGISYLDLPVGITSTSSEVPDKFFLHQNYPNPFNPKTIINYELRITNFVTLKIYNSIGNEVTTLVDQKQNAGTYSVDWNASNYPSGVYYYKIETDNFSDVKKMILLK